MGKKFGFSFSWKRALGISAFKGKVSRAIGIPLTKSGRQRKAGRLIGDAVSSALIGGAELALHKSHPNLPVYTPPLPFAFAWPKPISADTLPEQLALSPRALNLATERPRGWEFLLFAQIMLDETRKAKRQLARGNTTPPEPSDIQSVVQFLDWTNGRLAQLQFLCDHASEFCVTNENLAFGPPGEPGNVPAIVSLSRQMGYLCQRAADWTQEIGTTPMLLIFHDVARELQRFAEVFIASAENFAEQTLQRIEDALTKPPGTKAVIDLTWKLGTPDQRQLISALEVLKTRVT